MTDEPGESLTNKEARVKIKRIMDATPPNNEEAAHQMLLAVNTIATAPNRSKSETEELVAYIKLCTELRVRTFNRML